MGFTDGWRALCQSARKFFVPLHPHQRHPKKTHRAHEGERGQALTLALLALGIFLIAAATFSTDLAHLLVHKQLSQNAANAACAAGAMDLMVGTQGNNLGSFTPGTNFSCSGSPNSAPCKYAAINGFSGAGLATNQPSSSVEVSFPPGASCPGDGCPAPGE